MVKLFIDTVLNGRTIFGLNFQTHKTAGFYDTVSDPLYIRTQGFFGFAQTSQFPDPLY